MGLNKTRREQSRLQGVFQLPDNQEVFGELLIKGRNTLLSLDSHSELPPLREVPHLLGTTLDRQKVTCIDCVSSSQGSAWKANEATHHYADVFPHFVTVGDEHIDPAFAVVRSIHFSVDDLSSLFYDFDAFGHVIDAKPVIDTVLAEQRRLRPVETGEWPQVAYFTGRLTVIEVETDIGKLSVNHRPSFNMGGPDGVFIKNRMVVSVEPGIPVVFGEAVDRIMTIARFLSVIAGRRQGIHDIELQTAASHDQASRPLTVHWSYAPKGHGANAGHLKPHPGDVPLDPIRRPEEFSTVLKNWLGREAGWRLSRVRYVSGLSKGNSYDADRLVAAANMFDILPAEATPRPTALPDDLAESQAACLAILRKHSPSQDRDSAISAIKRIGKPSLPKKIQHRAAIVEKHFGSRFAELAGVAKLALLCRNYFVHGGSDDINFSAVEPFMSFLTDTLEFVFAASDLIEAGWDAAQWSRELHGTGHTFARYRGAYDGALAELRRATASTP